MTASAGYERKLTAVLHADVAGYSRMSGADEETTHRIFRGHLLAGLRGAGFD